MGIDDLLAVVEPPVNPKDATGDWADVERTLTQLPNDYKALIRQYGAGSFANSYGYLVHLLPTSI